jgi:hypothetical protein
VSGSEGIVNNDNLLWAVDHGFEYVEINESSLLESESNSSFFFSIFLKHFLLAHTERDKNGLPRVVEAVQSVMWSTAQKKTLPKVKSGIPESEVTKKLREKNKGNVSVTRFLL